MSFIALNNNFSELLRRLKKQMLFQTELKWRIIIIFVGFFHLFGLYWSYLHAFPTKWQTILFAFLMAHIGGMGITCGVHRLWTHKSYKAKLPLRIYLMLAFSSTGQNSIYDWVRDHRLHHKFSDTDADPHNINRGFFFSHMGWLMIKKNNHVLEKGQQIDMSDILEDPVAVFERKYSNLLSLLFCFLLPTMTGIILWGETWKCAVAWHCFIKYLSVLHAEMTVNSFAHMFGYKPYNQNIRPAQNAFVSVITIGEGWHNYHHTFPYDYKAAETCDFLQLSTVYIRVWAKMGLAYDLKEPSPELVQAVIKRQESCNRIDKPVILDSSENSKKL